jgi:3-oxoacyl-[acyl-carrier protein] reductase
MPIITGLEKKTIVITGGANGIGRATAQSFAAENARVIIVDINPDALSKTKLALDKLGYEIETYTLDVSNSEAVEACFSSIKERFKSIDVLVNNAGILKDRSLLKMSYDEWDAVINVNLKGVFNCGKVAAAIMVEQGSGVILNASSVVGLYGNYGQSNYVATKSGVIGMTKVWARELGSKGIRVNAVAPGFISTDILKDMPDDILQKLAAKAPLKRLGTPEDVANAYVFLASDQATFITGTTLSVDGGVIT